MASEKYDSLIEEQPLVAPPDKSQNTIERSLSQAALQTSENHYRSLFESSRDGILILDAAGRKITDVNPFMLELLGYSRDEILGRELWEIGLFKDRVESRIAFRDLQATGYIRYENIPLETKTGEIREVEFVSNVYAEGDQQLIQCNIRDNTEHKRVKEISEQSREWLLAIFEASHDGIVVEECGQLVFVNNRFVRMFGYERPDEVLKNPTLRFQKPEDAERMAEYGRMRLRGEEAPTFYEFTGVNKDGREMDIEACVSILHSNGKLYIVTAQRDISERKQREEAQRRQQTELRVLFDLIPAMIWFKDTDNSILRVNKHVANSIGKSVEEIEGKSALDIYPEMAEKFYADDLEVIRSGKPKLGIVERLKNKDGQEIWVQTDKVPYHDTDGKVIGIIVVARDITESKDLEEALQQSEAKFRNIIDVSPVPYALNDNQQNITFVNAEFVKCFGYTLEEVPTLAAWWPLAYPDSEYRQWVKTTWQSHLEKAMREGTAFEPIELKVQCKAGRIRTVMGSAVALGESFDGIHLVILYDITEHKQTEKALRQSEKRYRLLFERNPQPMWVFDVVTYKFLTVNESAMLHYGYSLEEFLSMTIMDIRPPEEIPSLMESFSSDRHGLDYSGIWKHLRKDGSIIDVEITTHRLIFDGREAELVLANDVTERKVAERSIRFQAQLLDTVEQAVIATDLDGQVNYWNQFAQKLYGWSAEEAQGRNIIELTTPQIMAEQAREIMSSLRQGNSWAGEFKVQRRDGTIFPALVNDSPIQDHLGNLLGMVGVSIDITERKLAEEALQQAEARYRSIVESLPAIVYLSEPLHPYAPIYISPNIVTLGYSLDEWFQQPDLWMSLLHEEDREGVLRATEKAMSGNLETDLEYRIVAREGTIHWIHDKGRFVSDGNGKKIYWQGVMLDITKTKELEAQLRQSQKLESVGRLAGGIAHDFNNMLTAINGYSDLTLRLLQDNDPLRHNLEEIKKAGERSASLTHQLLAFSRQQVLQPVVLDLNEVITDTIKMIQRLIGEDVQLVTALNPKAGRVKVDPGQLTQIIMNLAVNARDAMPLGGQLTIETANVFLDPDYARAHVGVIPGAYVMLAISDTGMGMDAQIQQHIFEPFFTTKEIGKGTGLGLATVYGIVKQSGGHIGLYSEVEVGTTFKIYLPRVIEKAEAAEAKAIADGLPLGTETILLVEDEDIVRALTRQILEMCGYTVLEARNGVEALAMCETRVCKFDLLMTDVVMPQMGGRELAVKFAQTHPQMRVLFTSGYTDDAIVRHGVIEAGTNFIQKPFSPDALALKIREVLDQPQ